MGLTKKSFLARLIESNCKDSSTGVSADNESAPII